VGSPDGYDGRVVGMAIGYADRVFPCLEVDAARCWAASFLIAPILGAR